MKKLFVLLTVLGLLQACTPSEAIFELQPAQSMSISGKGPGQDAAINPYLGKNSIAVVKNIGKNSFDIRVQKDGTIIENVSIQPKETKNIVLKKGYELYFDSETEGKGRVTFKPYKGK